jgi:hypothetical protein
MDGCRVSLLAGFAIRVGLRNKGALMQGLTMPVIPEQIDRVVRYQIDL